MKHISGRSRHVLLLAMALPLLTIGCGSQQSESIPPGETPEGNIAWTTDFNAASAQAAKEGKTMLLNFTGSDWCPWCFKIRDEIFTKPEFEAYAKSDLVCVYLDFPNSKPQSDALKKENDRLAKKFGVKGFPTILILSPDGKVIGKSGYRPGGAAKYVEHLREMIDGSK